MQSLLLLTLFSACLALSAAGRRDSYSVTLTSTPCTPRRARKCGTPLLLNSTSTDLAVFGRYGPNVCRITRTYNVRTLAYVEANYCFRSRCFTYCTPTENCTGAFRTIPTIETNCCDGYAVNPDDATGPESNHRREHHRREHHSRNSIFRTSGCSLMLRDSVADCLLELSLEAFTVQLLVEAPAIVNNELGNGASSSSYTVFALNDTAFDNADTPLGVQGYIVNRTVEGKRLKRGMVLQTLMPNVSLHVGRVHAAKESGNDAKSIFVNGAEVSQLNACQAKNGIVHIVSSPIPLSDMTIATRLRQDSRFSKFLQLLDGADITRFLNDTMEGNSFTVLAPTNAAFDNLPANAVECLLSDENKKALNQIVLLHISDPAEYNATLSQRSRLYTFNRRYYLIVQTKDGTVELTSDRIPIEEADIAANNGVIHAIPDVIVPVEVDFGKLNCPAITGGSGDIGSGDDGSEPLGA